MRIRGVVTLHSGVAYALLPLAIFALTGQVTLGQTAPPTADSAATITSLQQQLNEIQQRQAALENELRQAREQNANVTKSPRSAEFDLSRLPPTEATPSDAAINNAKPASETHWADQFCQTCKERLSWNKGEWRIVPFGSLEAQMLGATDEVTGRSTVVYVNQKSSLGPLPQNNISGQPSTLGFDFSGPEVGNLKSGGRIFMNFMGDRPLLNQSTPFLINAYGELKNDDWRFLFGQYFALVNPLNPTLINFGLGIDTGNICSYRGQFRIERYYHIADNVMLTSQIAVSQQFVTDFMPPDEWDEVGASDNGLPNLEGRVALALGPKVEGLNVHTFELGISSMVGQARAIRSNRRQTPVEDMLGCDAQLSASRIGIKGEFFCGQGLSSYGGGIGQGINNMTQVPIRDAGGWLELWTKPLYPVTVAVGYGIDHPVLDDLREMVGAWRTRNDFIYTTALWDITNRFNMGFEVDFRKTGYSQLPTADELPETRLYYDNSAVVYWFRTRLAF